MGTTWFKRLENRCSRATIKLLNIEDPNSRGHNIAVPPGTHIALDMKIPWAPLSTDFPAKHMELQVDGITRYWIWQATKSDGDFIRYSTDTGWHDPGEHVFGYAASAANIFEAIGGAFFQWDAEELLQFVLTERTLVVMDSHFETIPIQPKPSVPAHTFIKRLENRTAVPITLFSTRTQQTITAPAATSINVDMEVPWALGSNDFLFPFATNHLEVAIGGVKRFWLWQHDNPNDGDYVRFSTTPGWIPFNNRVKGFAETGECPGDLVFTTGRTLIVSNTEVEMQPNPLLLPSRPGEDLRSKVYPF